MAHNFFWGKYPLKHLLEKHVYHTRMFLLAALFFLIKRESLNTCFTRLNCSEKKPEVEGLKKKKKNPKKSLIPPPVIPLCSKTPRLCGPSTSPSTSTCCRAAESTPTRAWRWVWFLFRGSFPCFAAQWSVWHVGLFTQFLNFSCTRGGERPWHVNDREWHGPRPHVSHNSSRRLVKSSKQEVGRAYLIFFRSHLKA